MKTYLYIQVLAKWTIISYDPYIYSYMNILIYSYGPYIYIYISYVPYILEILLLEILLNMIMLRVWGHGSTVEFLSSM